MPIFAVNARVRGMRGERFVARQKQEHVDGPFREARRDASSMCVVITMMLCNILQRAPFGDRRRTGTAGPGVDHASQMFFIEHDSEAFIGDQTSPILNSSARVLFNQATCYECHAPRGRMSVPVPAGKNRYRTARRRGSNSLAESVGAGVRVWSVSIVMSGTVMVGVACPFASLGSLKTRN